MSSPLAMSLGYHTYSAAFDPLSLSPIYMTQTDSYVSGTLTDMVASYAFTNANAAQRPTADTTTVTGHTVMKFDGSATTRKWLSLNNPTLAAQLDGPVACTFCVWIKIVTMPSVQVLQPGLIAHTQNTTTFANPSVRVGLLPTGTRATAAGATRTTSYDGAPSFSGGWQLLAFTWNGSTTGKYWLDGVQQGADVTQLTPGSVSGQTNITFGDLQASSVGLTREYYVGGHFTCLGPLSSANLIALSTWYANSFA